jgi:hypothetical protein
MSKKPTAALSANLVAVKGSATPAPDMPPGRAAPALVTVPPAVLAAAASHAPVTEGEEGGQPLNFRVSASFRREFKVFAAEHGLKLNELLRRSFDAYRRQQGN